MDITPSKVFKKQTIIGFVEFAQAHDKYPKYTSILYFAYVYLVAHKRWKQVEVVDLKLDEVKESKKNASGSGVCGYALQGVDPFIQSKELQYVLVCSPAALLTTSLLMEMFTKLAPIREEAAEQAHLSNENVKRRRLDRAVQAKIAEDPNRRVSARCMEQKVRKEFELRGDSAAVVDKNNDSWRVPDYINSHSFSLAVVHEETSISFYRIHSNFFRSKPLSQLRRVNNEEDVIDAEAATCDKRKKIDGNQQKKQQKNLKRKLKEKQSKRREKIHQLTVARQGR